jgi:HlyD family secretion protein/macrolide-specific efflux system membrane fusion protein
LSNAEKHERSISFPRRRRAWPYVTAAVLLLGAGSAYAVRAPKEEKIDQTLVVTAKRVPLAIEVIDVGRVEAFEEVEILSKVSGRVAEVLVKDGDTVKKGDPIILLDTRDYGRVVARERAMLDTAQAKLGYAERQFAKKRELAREGLLSALDFDVAERELDLMKLDVRTARVTLTQAEDRLRDARIVAPASGTAIRRKIEPGEMVIPGVESTFEKRALLMIADLSRLVIKIELNQIDVSKVRLGQKVTATFDGLPDQRFAARVTEISPASTKAKDLDVFPIKAELDHADPRIKPGMTADVRVHIEEKPDAVTVPLESVTHEAGKAFVKRVIEREKRRHTERVEVVLGTQNDRFAEIVSGVSEGEQVLLDPPSAAKAEKAM